MTFLPIVERELRVASRKPSTFWVRIAAALVALVIGSGFLVLTMTGTFGFGPASFGKGLFGTLTWLSLAVALSAGLFFTSDCLSEEKREGTLGFLFLTDLRGYDVVLGKLLATSLRGAYALLAVFPILAVSLLMGGVTGGQFWKTALALVNALFVSVAAGLFVSAISRESQKALAATLFLLVLVVAGGPGGDAIIASINQRGFQPLLSLSSPGYLFVTAGAWGRNAFWPGLLVNQAVGWSLLGLSCLLLPRTWQERTATPVQGRGDWARSWKFGTSRQRTALRRKLVEVNPVLWLACRERWQAVALWAVALLASGGTVVALVQGNPSGWWLVWSSVSGLVTLILYLGIASQACRFFVEARRSGLIELLLATPLTVTQILQGQWRAMLRMFGPPLALFLAAQLVGAAVAQHLFAGAFAPAAAAVPVPAAPAPTNGTTTTVVTVTNSVTIAPNVTFVGTTTGFSASGGPAPNAILTLAISLAVTLTAAANLVALVWFGMWMGLVSTNTNLATLKTIIFVQVIPWFVGSFVLGIFLSLFLIPRFMGIASTTSSQVMIWFPLITSGATTGFALCKDVGFVIWARRKLTVEFRERAAQGMSLVPLPRPPPLPRATAPGPQGGG